MITEFWSEIVRFEDREGNGKIIRSWVLQKYIVRKEVGKNGLRFIQQAVLVLAVLDLRFLYCRVGYHYTTIVNVNVIYF
jgi:prophage antirepressor-like protein